MRKLILAASIVALAACSQEPAEEPVVEEEVVEPAATSAPPPGDYLVVYDDGREQPFTMNADGSWSSQDAEGAATAGTWTDTDGKTCFVTDPPSEDDSCWTNSAAAADGSFSSTSDAGVTVTVRPAVAEAATAAEPAAE